MEQIKIHLNKTTTESRGRDTGVSYSEGQR